MNYMINLMCLNYVIKNTINVFVFKVYKDYPEPRSYTFI
jgi:hypothetical protein